MDDVISRQAAIDALGEKPLAWEQGEYEEGLQTQWESDVEAIKALPLTQSEPCEDAVSRKAVKDGFVEMCNLICPYTEKQRHAMCGSCLLGTAFDVLEATHSVTPKQRTGKWEYRIGQVACSLCGKAISRIVHDGDLNFCPNCGAKMEGVSNEYS